MLLKKLQERKISYQMIDIAGYGMSNGEYQSVKKAVGSLECLLDKKSKEYEKCHIAYLAYDADKEQKLLDNPGMFKTPIVRNGKLATIGFQPDVWKKWE